MRVPPAFSIITSAYQAAGFLPRCHWSLTRQTVADWEWVVVDDASTDGTAELIGALGDARIRYHRFPENRGRGVARDFALQQACGRWSAVLDADDFSFPDRLARAGAARAQGYDFLCSSLALIDHDYRVTGVRGCAARGYPREFTHGTLCGDTALLQRIGYPAFRRAQDQTMVLTLANTRRGYFCEQPLYVYHENASVGVKDAFVGHYYALRQIHALARKGVLKRGVALTRAQLGRWAKLAGLLPFFLWPRAYLQTLRARAKASHGAGRLTAEERAFIAECAQRFPRPGSGPAPHAP